MHRRRLLAAGGAGLATLVAGCLGGDDGPDPLEERPPENEVVDALRTAVGELNTAGIELGTVDGAGDADGIDLDRERVSGRIDEARAALDTVAGLEAADEFQSDIDAARAFADVVEALFDGTTSLDDASGPIDELQAAYDREDYDAAEASLDDARPLIDDARTRAESADGGAGDLDDERLETYGALTEEIRGGAVDLLELAVGADELSLGYDELLSGREHMETGRDQFDADEYGPAEDSFGTAEGHFQTATDHFETGDEASGDTYDEEFVTALCRSGHLEDASGHFRAAAAAADDGSPRTARDERDAGEEALDRAGACGSDEEN